MSQKLRIGILNNQGLADSGGGVTILRNLVTAWGEQFDLRLITEAAPDPGWPQLDQRLIPAAETFGDWRWRFSPWLRARARAGLPKSLVADCDVLLVLDPYFALYARRSGKPYIYLSLSCVARQEHFAEGGSGSRLREWQYVWLERLAATRARAIVVASEAHRREMTQTLGLSADRMTVLSPIFPAAGTGRSSDATEREDALLIAVGRLTAIKNQARLLPILSRLRARGVRANLVLLGSGEDAARIRREIEARGLTDAVTLAGSVDDPVPWYRRATLLLHPSGYESFGMAVHEAMRWGLPALVQQPSSSCIAAADAIAESGGGLLVDFDDAEAVAAEIAKLLNDPQRRAELAQAGLRHAATLDQDIGASGYADSLGAMLRAAILGAPSPEPSKLPRIETS